MRVFLYAGQGSQTVGMGRDLYEAFPVYRRTAKKAAEVLLETETFRNSGLHPLQLMHEGPEELLSDTRYTQPCMAVFAAGVTALLLENGIRPDAAGGLSLGEYGALYAAGVWDLAGYLKLVAFRGAVMADAAKGKAYVMSAVLNAQTQTVKDICSRICEEEQRPERFVRPVNFNAPGQIVICGDADSIDRAEQLLLRKTGVRCIRLNTASPFHTPVLEPAEVSLRQEFDRTGFLPPQIPVVLNRTGTFAKPAEELKTLLAEQVCHPVRFEEDLRSLLLAGAEEYIEIGPGNVLAGLCRKTARHLGKTVRVQSIRNADDVEKLLAAAKTRSAS